MGHDFLTEEINEDKHFVGQSMVSEIFDYMRNSEEHVGKKKKQTKNWAGDVSFLTHLITEALGIEEVNWGGSGVC